MRKSNKLFIALVLLLIGLAGCVDTGSEVNPTSTSTLEPTPSPTATLTPIPPTPTASPTLDPCEDDTPYNGWLYHETCIPGVVDEDFWLSPNPEHFVGIATWYGEGVMEKVAANRGLSLDNVWGGVALMNCGDIGSHVWIKRGPQFEFEGPYLVVDCSKREHLYWNVVENGLAVEVDWNTKNRWGMTGGIVGVHVCKTKGCSRGAVTLSNWFLQNVIWEQDPGLEN